MWRPIIYVFAIGLLGSFASGMTVELTGNSSGWAGMTEELTGNSSGWAGMTEELTGNSSGWAGMTEELTGNSSGWAGMTEELTGNSSVVAKDYELCYLPPKGTVACMSFAVNQEEQTISFHMQEDEYFNDVTTLENYNIEFAASRETEYCFIRRLASNTTFDDQVASFEERQYFILEQEIPGEIHLWAIPFENPDEILGEKLVEFCGVLPIYKLLRSTPSEDLEPKEYERLGDITFTKCNLFTSRNKCFIIKPIEPTSADDNSFPQIIMHS